MATKSPDTFGSANQHRRNSWRMGGLIVVILVAVTGVFAGGRYLNSNDEPTQTAQQAELIRQQAKQYNQSTTTATGQLKSISDDKITIIVKDKEQTYRIGSEAEINRGNSYEAIKLTDINSGAAVSVTYMIDNKQVVALWQQEK